MVAWTKFLVSAATVCALLGLSALSGCDRVDKLEEGVSTEVEVRKQFGEPATIIVEPDGSRTFEYPRQPEGWTNYLIKIGPDGKMSSLRQLLNEDNFAKVKPGMTQLQVRAILGRHAKAWHFDLKNEDVLDWRFKKDNESKMFSVTFAADGKATTMGIGPDTREQQRN
jgi:SmpA / OmlA family